MVTVPVWCQGSTISALACSPKSWYTIFQEAAFCEGLSFLEDNVTVADLS
jgi:hypothetical protein